MLWKRESIAKDAPFVDFLAECSGHRIFRLLDEISETKKVHEKSGKLSMHYRIKAQSQIESKNWNEAIELLNEALCFAENGSEDLCCAYTERAMCFFNLKMYNSCLIDIKLARSNNCPQTFQPRLSKLNDSCKRMLKQSPDEEVEIHIKPKLSFDACEQNPNVANVITVDNKEKLGRCIMATRDIGVGQTIMIEEGFVWSTTENYRRCCICLKTTTNLVPCKECTDSLMCYGRCENDELHKIECDMAIHAIDVKGINHFLVVRSILMALHTIPNINELIRFVERVVSGKDQGTINFASTQLSRYAVFLENGLKRTWPKKEKKIFVEHIKRVYERFMDHDEFAELFEDEDHQRFLMHLIGHHCNALRQIASNSAEGEDDGTSVYSILGGFFSHSCYPNTVLVTSDQNTVAVTIRPIERGEEVTISYLSDELNRSTKYRRKCLLERYSLMCFCKRCSEPTAVEYKSKTLLSQQQKSDFRNASNRDPKKQVKRRKLTVACIKYLNTNGKERWNDDMSLVLLTYIHLLRTKYYLNLQH